jgi:hypothetical protein
MIFLREGRCSFPPPILESKKENGTHWSGGVHLRQKAVPDDVIDLTRSALSAQPHEQPREDPGTERIEQADG